MIWLSRQPKRPTNEKSQQTFVAGILGKNGAIGLCGRLGLSGFLTIGHCLAILLLEALDASRGVNELLLTGKKWVAVRAYFEAQHVAIGRRPSLKLCIAAGAMDGYSMIFWMDAFFHNFR